MSNVESIARRAHEGQRDKSASPEPEEVRHRPGRWFPAELEQDAFVVDGESRVPGQIVVAHRLDQPAVVLAPGLDVDDVLVRAELDADRTVVGRQHCAELFGPAPPAGEKCLGLPLRTAIWARLISCHRLSSFLDCRHGTKRGKQIRWVRRADVRRADMALPPEWADDLQGRQE